MDFPLQQPGSPVIGFASFMFDVENEQPVKEREREEKGFVRKLLVFSVFYCMYFTHDNLIIGFS